MNTIEQHIIKLCKQYNTVLDNYKRNENISFCDVTKAYKNYITYCKENRDMIFKCQYVHHQYFVVTSYRCFDITKEEVIKFKSPYKTVKIAQIKFLNSDDKINEIFEEYKDDDIILYNCYRYGNDEIKNKIAKILKKDMTKTLKYICSHSLNNKHKAVAILLS